MTCKWCGVDIHDRRVKVCPCCDRNLKTGAHDSVYQDNVFEDKPSVRNGNTAEESLPQGYVTLSYLLMIICILYGLRQLMFFANFGWNAAAYKGLIKCLASLVFLPKIKVGAESPYIGLVIKVLVYIILVAVL